MSNLRVETWTMPAANLGPENPLPRLVPRLSATAGQEVDASVPTEDRQHFGYGLNAGWLPHRGQDDYDRTRTPRDFLALVLENEFLRATVLPEIGGRLWSLLHKPTGRELLHVNPVFQPANLAIRGAWISSGVEWNACVYGHSPYTCSPLFAARVADKPGEDTLRLWQWDRTRGVPYQLDFSLPAGSQFLFVRVRITNPHPQTIPMYWWSNIEVPEAAGVRVLAPAERAYSYEYWGKVFAVPLPRHEGVDLTYTTNITYAGDYFFRIPDGGRPWITALDRDGRGLIQTSTSQLVGRKLYAWGTNAGGSRWQQFLATPGTACLEIQAGLARTQMECLPMPAGARWEWMEAYGLMQADAAKVHGSDWNTAIGHVGERLQEMLPHESLEARLQQTAALAEQPPEQILLRGYGWGALERWRREAAGEAPFCSPALPFDDGSLGPDQAPWLALLEQGELPCRDPATEPGAWMVQSEWRELLQQSIATGRSDHWLGWLHLGLMHFADGNRSAARDAWQRSTELRASAWAYRNLAQLTAIEGDSAGALTFYRQAHQLLPLLQPLAVEYVQMLLETGHAREAVAVIESLPPSIRRHSRLQLLEANAGLSIGQLDRVGPILDETYELIDIREGETSLSDLWFALQAKTTGQTPAPPPPHLDFRVTK
jgi:hypothetical protein